MTNTNILQGFQSSLKYHQEMINKGFDTDDYLFVCEHAEKIVKLSYAAMLLKNNEDFSANVCDERYNTIQEDVISYLLRKQQEVNNKFYNCIEDVMSVGDDFKSGKEYVRAYMDSIRYSMEGIEARVNEKYRDK